MEERKRFAVGYALAPKKQVSFIQDSLVQLAAERGIDLVPIDLGRPLLDQGPFDCVLHKLCSDDWKRQLKEFEEKNPRVLIIDQPEAIELLHNRISMLQVVAELEMDRSKMPGAETASFGIPKQTVIYEFGSVSEVNVEEEGLRFPVISKPLVADGSAKSHKMLLVYNNDGLNKLKPPIVLQEFVNHGGVIFKVYVVGEYVKCVKRKSLPDISEENLRSLEGSLSFCQVSNVGAHEINPDKYDELMHLESAELPPMSLITEIAKGLRRATKLHLFNFDVIRDAKDGNRYLVIDINYFPGYAKMPDYETVLVDFFWKLLTNNDKDFDVAKLASCEIGTRNPMVDHHRIGEDEGVIPVSPLKREEKEHSLQV